VTVRFLDIVGNVDHHCVNVHFMSINIIGKIYVSAPQLFVNNY